MATQSKPLIVKVTFRACQTFNSLNPNPEDRPMKSPSDVYAQLELLNSTESRLYPPTGVPASAPPRTLPQQIVNLARRAVLGCVKFLVGSTDPVIRQKRDRTGRICFVVWDPIKGQSQRFYTEQALRVWLENRYHN
jgi:hypothetical protein